MASKGTNADIAATWKQYEYHPTDPSPFGTEPQSIPNGSTRQLQQHKNSQKQAWHDDEETSEAHRNTCASIDDDASASSSSPHPPPSKPHALQGFQFLQFVAIVASLRLAGTQILPFVFMQHDSLALLERVLRVYMCLFCIGICLIELELPIPMIQNSRLLQNFLTRGLLYAFLALAAMREAFSVQVQDLMQHALATPWMAIFTEMSSWPVFVVGHVYMVLGVCCLKPYRDRLKRRYQEEMTDYREAVRLSRRQGGVV